MRILFILATFIFSLSSMQAQKAPTYTKKSDSKSVAILKKVHQKYSAYKAMKMDIKLTVKSGSTTETQNAKLTVKGNKFRMNSKDNDIASDGKKVYNHQKTAKELYISLAEDEDMMIFGSPDKMLKVYEKDFISALVGTATENGKTVYKIEFKPKSKNSDFTKIRITIVKDTSRIKRIKIFDRSNTHYTIAISNFTTKVSASDSYFMITEKNVPKGTTVVRMDD